MRCITCLTIVGLNLFSGACLAADEKTTPSEASSSSFRRVAREQEKRVLHSLSGRITLEAEDVPLKEALQTISQMIDREILIDQQGLSDEGISTDQSVTLNLGEMTVWQTLHFLLEPLQLTWSAQDGILEITTRTRAEERLVTRVYDVRNLCKLLEPLTKELSVRGRRKHPHGSLNQGGANLQGGGGMGGMGGGMGGGGGYFSIPIQATAACIIGQFGGNGGGIGGGEAGRAEAVHIGSTSVEALLARTIPDWSSFKWVEKDGEGGSVQLGQGYLIISQTYQGQFEIAGMLQALERLVEGKVRGKSIAAHRIGYPADEDSAIFETLANQKNLEIEDEALQTVLDQISREAGIRLLIDRAAFSDEGISTDQIVNLQMHKLPLGICLKKILDPLQCTYVVDEGVLVVTTNTRSESMMTIRLYDISGCWKITKDDPDTGLIPILHRSTSGKWDQRDGEGGLARLVSSKHLFVLQSQQVHAEIELLIDDLTTDGPDAPTEPVVKLRVYTAPDLETAGDLLQVLPRMLGKEWIAQGSIHQVGKSLLINQTAAVHDRVDEIMEALEDSQRRQNPVFNSPASVPSAVDPATAKGAAGRTK